MIAATGAPVDAGGAVPGRRAIVVNFVLFQAAWFACIYAAAHQHSAWGTACIAAVVAWHLHTAVRPGRELALVACALVIGGVFDSAVAAAGLLRYADGQFDPRLAPHWIVALWALFATTLNVSLRWLKGRWWIAALLGAVAAPLSYAGGVRMGAAEFGNAPLALCALGLGWAVLMPLLMRLSMRFDGMQAVSPESNR